MNQQLQIEISRLLYGSLLLVNDLLSDNIVLGKQYSDEAIKSITKNYFEEHMGDDFRTIKITIEEYK